jgi:hypothetical protein
VLYPWRRSVRLGLPAHKHTKPCPRGANLNTNTMKNAKEKQTGKAWLLVPNRGTRLIVDVPIKDTIKHKGTTFNVFTYRRNWYINESETGLKVVGHFKTKAQAISAFMARLEVVDSEKIKESIKSNFTTKAAFEVGDVLTFRDASAA